MLPASEKLSLTEIRLLLADRYGISNAFIERLRFTVRGDEIWATTAPETEWELIASRPPGIRALRMLPRGVKPTSGFLVFLGGEVRTSRVEIEDRAAFEQLLLGRSLPSELEEGYVAVSFCGDVIGCGEVRHGKLRALLATGRRNTLLHILQRMPK